MTMLEHITPVILTLNEEANIGRCLERLRWASEVVVVDSLSTDRTREIATAFSNVRWVEHPFDGLANQWNFAVDETGITTPWVLALDADYILPEDLVSEIASLEPAPDVRAYEARFVYCVYGRQLRGSLYPPVRILFRRAGRLYAQDGHTHRLVIDGNVPRLHHAAFHDDRKPLSAWLATQDRHMKHERDKIRRTSWSELGWPDRIRRLRVVAPIAVLLYSLFIRGTILDGWRGVFYSLQRALAETLLSLRLLESDIGDL